MKTMCGWLFILAAQLLPYPARSDAPDTTTIYSAVLKEPRHLTVYFPDGYQPGNGLKYDVSYVLDGEFNTDLVRQAEDFLCREGLMPPNLIVSIPNRGNLRDRDMTPSHDPSRLLSGGAGAFLAFLQKELIPYINRNYPSTGRNTVFGQSLSGLFGLYAYFKAPGLFQSSVLADPSIWWDHKYILHLAQQQLSELPSAQVSLLISGRQGRPWSSMGIQGLDSLIRRGRLSTCQISFLNLAGETHNSTRYVTFYEGLKFTYQGYLNAKIKIVPESFLLLLKKPCKLWCRNDFPQYITYTLNGLTKPLHYMQEISPGKAHEITLNSRCNRPEYQCSDSLSFERGQLPPPTGQPAGSKPGGRISGSFNGWLKVSKPGYYTFELNGIASAELSLGGQVLIDRNYHSCEAWLEQGYYPIALLTAESTAGNQIDLVYNTPLSGDHFFRIPSELLYQRY